MTKSPMKKTVMVMTAAAALMATSAFPALSAPVSASAIAVPASMVESVQYRPGYQSRPAYRQGYRQGQRQGYRQGFYNNRGNYYYNGHRGYNYARPGYRQYNGWWFPAGAFAAGALIGGAIAAQPRQVAPAGNAHYQWCASQYRSYRASDNSFQPNNGPRRQCVSPYG
ncbi:hypothetical protein FHS55_002407 [Angulomicrobium tetraedrale]|uniref:Lectin-like protein BA14k n=1 Tax=Ancylobacter tetraedralis TaxID=217068 RepID=A0A839ZAT4_9HYPH|nr:BA14K family protein [Ancylobacter tetraedralis]MBB3771798.1 hypothetical protein [Ancylobacter tetraedralis]